MKPTAVNKKGVGYPSRLGQFLHQDAPPTLWALGKLDHLGQANAALLCSERCPGNAILAAYDWAQKCRESGITVISGFHSPVERDCLEILLRGRQPVIICPARSLEGMRLPAAWRPGLEAGRLLLLSPFPAGVRRATAATAQRRNEMVAALADEVFIPWATPGGRVEALASRLGLWNVPHSARKGIGGR